MSHPFYMARFLIEIGDLAIFLKKDGRIICRCAIIKKTIRHLYSEYLEENEKWINFRNKTENLKSLKTF